MRAVAFGLLLMPALVLGSAADREIRYLLDGISHSGCQFERNGTRYEAARAVEHLEMKYRRARRYVGNADEFIARIGTQSSFSGRPYNVVCDGAATPSGRWLSDLLDAYRSDDRAKERAPEGAL